MSLKLNRPWKKGVVLSPPVTREKKGEKKSPTSIKPGEGREGPALRGLSVGRRDTEPRTDSGKRKREFFNLFQREKGEGGAFPFPPQETGRAPRLHTLLIQKGRVIDISYLTGRGEREEKGVDTLCSAPKPKSAAEGIGACIGSAGLACARRQEREGKGEKRFHTKRGGGEKGGGTTLIT